MCGIGGVWRYGCGGAYVDEGQLLRIRDAMISRGPDGAGIWISESRCAGLVHRRLAIIDLSSAGAQPMASVDGNLCITFNGEIYNYRELKKELMQKGVCFRSDSDTEVILQMYAEYGTAMLERLRGMFAFAIWDKNKKGLFLARDHLGIKPLYYADDGKSFRFASQVKALIAGGDIDTSQEPAGHVGFFLWGYVPEPYTFYKGVRALEAGTSLWIGEGGERKADRFFNVTMLLASIQPEALDDDVLVKRLNAALLDSLSSHMVADVPVGLFLSSGIDSIALACLARQSGVEKLKTITILFDGHQGTDMDESPLAQRVANHFGYEHETVSIQLENSSFQDDLDGIFQAMDQPSIDGVNSYFVSKVASQCGLKVALSGLGGDELFGGYPLFKQIPQIVGRLRPFGAVPKVGTAVRWASTKLMACWIKPRYRGLLEYGTSEARAYVLMRGLFMPWELPEVLDPDLVREGWQELDSTGRLEKTTEGISTVQGKIAALEMTWYMRNQLLRTADTGSMAHSVEIRVPFVDVQLLRTLAPLMLSSRPPNKKHLADSVNIKEFGEVFRRPKTGFNVPVGDWMTKLNGPENGEPEYKRWAKFVYSRAGFGT